MASHLLQHLGQATQVAVWKVLRLPQVQDHARGTGFGGKVVEISGRARQQPSEFTEFPRRFYDLKLQIRARAAHLGLENDKNNENFKVLYISFATET